jgi:hypothetical protein
MGMDDAIWYRHEIGNRSRPWLIESLQEFVKWIEGVHDGKFALMHDKSQPVKDAIDFLQGKKK